MNEIDLEQTMVLARQVEKELKKLGSPPDVLPAALLVIMVHARAKGTSYTEFMGSVERVAKAFGIFEYD